MGDLSSKTIMLLLLISIIISLMSFFSAQRGIIGITGFAGSGAGYASVNLTEEISILITKSINFYSGRVYANASSAILDSDLGMYNIDIAKVSIVQPGARDWAVMAYDSKRNVSVLFGGVGGVQYLNETWEYNGTAWTNSTAQGPIPRSDSSIAFDSRRNVTVLFGGRNSSSGFNQIIGDTWEYDGTTWSKITTANSPSPRYGAGMVYDSKRNVTVLFGGDTNPLIVRAESNETWEYNGTNWNNIITSTAPFKRFYGSMIYDGLRNVTVLYGGLSFATSYLNDTWEYDGTNWAEKTFSGDIPPARTRGAFSFDSIRNISVLFGGNTSSLLFGDVWEYNGQAWYNLTDEGGILAVLAGGPFAGVSAFDASRNRIVLFVEESPSGKNNLTLEYNASDANGVINGTWVFYKQYFGVENDGTVNISVNYSADKNAASFIGGASPLFQIKGKAVEAGACPGLVTAYTDVTASAQNLCPLLLYGQGADQFKMPIKLVIPGDSASGQKTATITFSAAKI